MRAILRKLLVRNDAGPVSGDLQIRLVVDRKAIHIGEKMKLTATLFNLSGEEVTVPVVGNRVAYLNCESAFRPLAASPEQQFKVLRTTTHIGSFSTGAGPLVVTIPAYGTVEYVAEVTFGAQLGGDKVKRFPLIGDHTLRVTLAVRPAVPWVAQAPRPRMRCAPPGAAPPSPTRSRFRSRPRASRALSLVTSPERGRAVSPRSALRMVIPGSSTSGSRLDARRPLDSLLC